MSNRSRYSSSPCRNHCRNLVFCGRGRVTAAGGISSIRQVRGPEVQKPNVCWGPLTLVTHSPASIMMHSSLRCSEMTEVSFVELESLLRVSKEVFVHFSHSLYMFTAALARQMSPNMLWHHIRVRYTVKMLQINLVPLCVQSLLCPHLQLELYLLCQNLVMGFIQCRHKLGQKFTEKQGFLCCFVAASKETVDGRTHLPVSHSCFN